jgi:hypothetical protein
MYVSISVHVHVHVRTLGMRIGIEMYFFAMQPGRCLPFLRKPPVAYTNTQRRYTPLLFAQQSFNLLT